MINKDDPRQKAHELILSSAMEIARQQTAQDIVARLVKIANRDDETTVGEVVDAIVNSLITEYQLDNKIAQSQPS